MLVCSTNMKGQTMKIMQINQQMNQKNSTNKNNNVNFGTGLGSKLTALLTANEEVILEGVNNVRKDWRRVGEEYKPFTTIQEAIEGLLKDGRDDRALELGGIELGTTNTRYLLTMISDKLKPLAEKVKHIDVPIIAERFTLKDFVLMLCNSSRGGNLLDLHEDTVVLGYKNLIEPLANKQYWEDGVRTSNRVFGRTADTYDVIVPGHLDSSATD